MTHRCQTCGAEIEFTDCGMGHYLPFNKSNGLRHYCKGLIKYCKERKGRNDYSCQKCKKTIPKGEKHYHFAPSTWNERFHKYCI